MGVKKTGPKFRIARKQKGAYLDIFVFSEKDLKGVGDRHLYMREGVILYEKDRYGSKFLRRLEKVLKKDNKPLPKDEIVARKVWAG